MSAKDEEKGIRKEAKNTTKVVSLATYREAREMGVQKRGEKWQVIVETEERYKSGRKKYYREGGFNSEKEARQREKQLLQEIQSKTFIPRSLKHKFEDIALRWLEKKKDEVRYKSWKRYKEIVELHLIPYFKGKFMEDITKKDMQKYYGENKHKIGQSIGKHKTVVNQIYDSAEDEGILTEEQSMMVRTVKAYSAKSPRVNIMETPEEMAALINSLRDSCLFLPVFFAGTKGMRASEVIALQWKDTLFTRERIDINKTLHHEADNGGHYLEEPKSYASARSIKLTQEETKMLAEIKKARNAKDDDYVCLNSQGKPFNTKTLSSNFRRAVRTAKRSNLNISFKSLRTSYINIMRDLGVEDTAIQEDVGHASINTTRQHYFKATQKQRERLNKAKENLVKGIKFSDNDTH